MGNRFFSEEEISKIIKRAAEIEAERSVAGRRGENGLTIDELKTVVSEAGLDPEVIDTVISEMDSPKIDVSDKIRVNRDEIATEIWLDCQPDKETINELVTELNHIYGTTDELNWWENLWGTHEGKAKVKKSSNTTEWNFETEFGMYSTRVLLQQRGERFRIRVSRRQMFGMEWDNAFTQLFLVFPVSIVLGVIGGVTSAALLGTGWPGVVAGVLLSMLTYPAGRLYSKRSVEKHSSEVANTVRQLTGQVMQSDTGRKNKGSAKDSDNMISGIELPDDGDIEEVRTGKLRNNLRE
jgi:hypothetical protein